MMISEYNRSKKHEYKYLIVAFSALSLQAFVNSVIFFFMIFSNFDCSNINAFMPLTHHALELFALVLLSNAFIYPMIQNKVKLKNDVLRDFFIILFFTFFVGFMWIISLTKNYVVFDQYPGFAIFLVLKLLILGKPMFGLFYTSEKLKYKLNIFLAFFLYSVAPFTSLLNYIFFNSSSARLGVFVQPWPFLSAILFTRAIYLKLVDKVFLKSKLKESQLKYKHEKELNRMKDDFVSVVSHELRTPLTSIKLYASMLKNKSLGKISKKQKEALDIVGKETDRLSNLINDILDLNKLESNKLSLCLAKFNLKELNNPIFYGLAEKKKISVDFKFPKNTEVVCDPDKIKQVFINIISNAAKFTDKGSIYVTFKNTSKQWQMIIKDEGKGIAKEHLPKLFDKFYQITGDHMTRTVKGTGLGLAIVKKIVDMHNGSIEVDSKLGKGTTFILIFPKI